MPKMIIIGLDHFLQNLNHLSLTEDGRSYEAEQKKHFVQVLEDAVSQNGVTLICEECAFNGGSPGAELARKYRCRHVNITTSREERERLEIPADYQNDPAQTTRAIGLFEEHMANAIRSELRDEDVGMVMVGEVHRTAVEKSAAEFGTVIDSRGLSDFEWYEGPPVMEAGTGRFLGSCKRVTGKIS